MWVEGGGGGLEQAQHCRCHEPEHVPVLPTGKLVLLMSPERCH